MLGLGLGIGLMQNVTALSGGPSATAWNPATSSTDFSETATTATRSTGTGQVLARANNGHSGTGDWSFTITTTGAANMQVGVANASEVTTAYCGQGGNNSVGWIYASGQILKNDTALSTPGSWVNGQTITVRLKNGKLYYALNGTYLTGMDPVAETGGVDVSAMGTLYPAVSTNGSNAFTADFTNWP